MARSLRSIDHVVYSESLSRESTRARRIPLTANAKKYGERGLNIRTISAGKSGLTPTHRVLGTIPESQQEYDTENDILRYQRTHLHEFTSQDLWDISAVEKADALSSSLWNTGESITHRGRDENIGIMPLLHRSNWILEIEPRVRIPGTTGFWDAQDDEVWKAMMSSLQLASRILHNSHTCPFYDTLFHGERRNIDKARIPKTWKYDRASTGPLQSIWPRAPHLRTAESARQDWANLTGHVMFGIDATREYPGSSAVTSWAETPNKSRITINPTQIEPLLSSQLTVCERLKCGFILASTILHELAHAIIFIQDAGGYAQEPYHQDEPVAEMGFAMENAIWGGLPMIYGPRTQRDVADQNLFQPPKFWIGREDYPSRFMYGCYNTGQTELDLDIQPGRVYETPCRPMRIDFMEDIQSAGFWTVLVGKYGSDMLQRSDLLSHNSNLSPFLDNVTPFERRRIGKINRKGNFPDSENRIEHGVYQADLDALGEYERNNCGKYRVQRVRTTRKAIDDLMQRKRDAVRAWRKWGDPRDTFPLFNLPKYYGLHQSDVITFLATTMNITPEELRTRGRNFVQNTIRNWAESKGIPRDHFDLPLLDRDILLSNEDFRRGVAAVDLDDLYQEILTNERNLGTDINKAILEPLAISQDGGDPAGMNRLKEAIRAFLELKNRPRDYFDREMTRRHTDPTDPLKTFYIHPNLQKTINLTRAELEKTGQTPHFDAVASDFEKSELLRDFLEDHLAYPRMALDDQIGNLPREPGDVDVLRERFINDVLVAAGREGDREFRRRILEPGFRRSLVGKLRPWLVQNGYSTRLDIGLGHARRA